MDGVDGEEDSAKTTDEHLPKVICADRVRCARPFTTPLSAGELRAAD